MGKTHEMDVYVRFCETDAAGHINNVSYFMYLEEARIKLVEALGMNLYDSDMSLNFILASTTCDYLAQAYGGETLHISSSVETIGTKSFRLQHFISRKSTGARIAKGVATMVTYNYKEQQAVPIPDFLREYLQLYVIESAVE